MVHKLVFLIISLPLVWGSLNDWQNPNLGKAFSESWLLQVMDFTYNDKIELVFGSSRSISMSSSQANVSISKERCGEQTSECDVAAASESFSTSNLNFTVIGGGRDEMETATNIRWEVNGHDKGGFFEQSGNITRWSFRIRDLFFEGQAYDFKSKQFGRKDLWFLHKLCLCRHTQNYEFQLDNYIIQNITSGKTTAGTNGVVAITQIFEKSSASSWLRAEGADPSKTKYLALSRSIFDHEERYFIHYRNKASGMTLNYNMGNSEIFSERSFQRLHITAVGSSHVLQIILNEQPHTFDQHESQPEKDGLPLNSKVYSNATAVICVRSKSNEKLFSETDRFCGVTMREICL